MSDPLKGSNTVGTAELLSEQHGSRISVPEIARRLNIGRVAVYSMPEQGIMPGIRLGRRGIVTRHAYEHEFGKLVLDSRGGEPDHYALPSVPTEAGRLHFAGRYLFTA